MSAISLLSFLNLVLINIRGAVSNESQLRATVDEMKIKPDIILLTETHMSDLDSITIPNYTCWSQPDPAKTGGTAILIHDRLLPTCSQLDIPGSTTSPPTGHTQWIRILNKDKPLYLSLSYISPNNLANYEATVNSLIETSIDLSTKGTCIHTGDFNDTNKQNKAHFIRMLKTLGVQSMYNPICTRKDKDWTYIGPNGRSKPDHILIPPSLMHQKNTYWVYQEYDCGSDHRLVQAKLTFNRIESTYWGTHHNRKCD
jgi:exonuclease III